MKTTFVLLRRFFTEEYGHGIAEYGATLAVLLLIISIIISSRGASQKAQANGFAPA